MKVIEVKKSLIDDDKINELELKFENLYKTIINYKFFKHILKFLNIKELIACAHLNMKVRYMVRWFFEETSFALNINKLLT